MGEHSGGEPGTTRDEADIGSMGDAAAPVQELPSLAEDEGPSTADIGTAEPHAADEPEVERNSAALDGRLPQESQPADGQWDDGGVSQLGNLSAAVQTLASQVQAFHQRAEKYELIIREMQGRLEQLQGDQVQALLKPVIQRLAGLHAQASEASENARDRGEDAEKDFNFFTVAIEEALGLLDIESVRAEVSGEFDPRAHHASRIIATDNAEQNNRIQRVVRQGFTYINAQRVFLPAQVSVYRYEPPPESPDPRDQKINPTSPPADEGAPGE